MRLHECLSITSALLTGNASKSSFSLILIRGAGTLVPAVFLDHKVKQLSVCVYSHLIYILAPLKPTKTDF